MDLCSSFAGVAHLNINRIEGGTRALRYTTGWGRTWTSILGATDEWSGWNWAFGVEGFERVRVGSRARRLLSWRGVRTFGIKRLKKGSTKRVDSPMRRRGCNLSWASPSYQLLTSISISKFKLADVTVT